LIAHLRARGIHVSDIWYDAPIAPKKCAARVSYKKGTCPNAEYTAEHILNLPTHINVSRKMAKKIAGEVNYFLENNHGAHF
jgi:dTDP-4-amino-4,6-dideoxygalactose transaminase